MKDQNLGRLERVELRDIWMSEASDFTPWLARSENLAVLADTLAIDLELEAEERAVGPFRADILCKDIGSDHWVLIENQLERTDHTHLGQLLTYAAGLQAVTIVWIAARFTEEHRATLDWLNKITDETFRFFGLEVELWKIGTSPAAPKFNIISKPNDWSRSVSRAARAIDNEELSDVRIMQVNYWTALLPVLDAMGVPFSTNRKPLPRSWVSFPIGRSKFRLSVDILRKSNQVRAQLYLSGDRAKTYFDILEREKDAIEQELEYSLEWSRLPSGKDCRILINLDNADLENTEDWPRQHKWLAERLNDLHRVFARRVKELDADELQVDDD